MSKLSTLTPIAAALAVSLAGVAHAAENPFAAKPVVSGFTVASHDAGHEGKCGEAKCGADKAKAMKEGKCGEGKCGADKAKAMKEGKCGEGKCGADKAKATMEGKCGADKAKEGHCGAMK